MLALPSRHRPRTLLPWPLPALLAWAGGWAAWQAAAHAGAAPLPAWGLGLGAALLLAGLCRGRWRRLLAAAGFPLSTLALGGLPSLPAWGWALLVLPLLALYPLGAWRDAPFFPTPRNALRGLEGLPGLAAPGAPLSMLDAGCGLGHGLAALRAVWPQARLAGIERGTLLRWGARLRCRWARVQGGDMWAADWSGHDLVYLFQRPESMPRAWAKACAELAPGAWLVSLEFAVPGVAEQARLDGSGRRPVWAYRVPPSTPAATGR
jgi:hypothetical protein